MYFLGYARRIVKELFRRLDEWPGRSGPDRHGVRDLLRIHRDERRRRQTAKGPDADHHLVESQGVDQVLRARRQRDRIVRSVASRLTEPAVIEGDDSEPA